MAVRTRDEIIELVKTRIGEDTSDEALTFLEDISDTLSDYDTRITESGDWKAKYEENDAEWRKRYKDRFEGKEVDDPDPEEPEVKTYRYEDLFKSE